MALEPNNSDWGRMPKLGDDSSVNDFAIELEIDRFEARVGPAVAEYLAARWAARATQVNRGPRLPTVLHGRRMTAQLERWHVVSRRAMMLWRWCAMSQLEAGPGVCAALVARDSAGLVRARNTAAVAAGWTSYEAFARMRDELDELDVIEGRLRCGSRQVAPRSRLRSRFGDGEVLGSLDPDAAVSAIVELFGTLGFDVDALRLDVALVTRIDAPLVARTFPVDPPGDVRVYVRAPHDVWGWRALAHELGHGAYAVHCDPALPWSLRAPPSRALDEGVAALAERIAIDACQDARTWQCERAQVERCAYQSSANGTALAPDMMDDPMAQPAYEAAHWIADALTVAAGDREGPALGEWLVERVFAVGATRSAAQLVAECLRTR